MTLIINNALASQALNPSDPDTYRTAEYNRQWGLEAIKAADAYAFLARNNKPVAGDGVLVGISDSGLLNYPDPEFTLNDSYIHFGNQQCPSETHGSFVTSVAVGVKNDSNTHGVAYNSKYMMANDNAYSAYNPYNPHNAYNLHLLAEYGAKVINISWEISQEDYESDYGPLSEDEIKMLRELRSQVTTDISGALQQDTVIAVAAGNDRLNLGDYLFSGYTIHIIDPNKYSDINQYKAEFNIPTADSVLFARDHVITGIPQSLTNDQEITHGKMILVGATDQNNNLVLFSDICGKFKDFCLFAPGFDIYATEQNQYRTIDGKLVDLDGEIIDPNSELIANATQNQDGSYFVSQFVSNDGTSFAAPHVTGAAAVLRGAWPQLSAESTVQILLTTATDLGAPGVDEIYGHGLLNLSEAVKPQGQTIIPSSDNVNNSNIKGYLSSSSSITASTAFGDAYERMATILKQAIFVDIYGRDYMANLDQRMSKSKDLVHKLQNMLIKSNPKFKTLPIYFGNNNSSKVTLRFTNQDLGSIYSIFKDKNVQYLAIDHSKPDLSNDLINKNTASFTYENNFNNNLKLGFAINNSDFNLANNFADNFSFINSTDFASSSPYQNLASNRFSGDNRENQVSSNRFLAAYKFNESWSSNLSYIVNNSNNFATGAIANNELQNRIFDSGITRKIGKDGQLSLNYGNMTEFNNNFLGSKTSGAFGTSGNPVTNYARIGYSQKLLSSNWSFIASYSEGVTKVAGNEIGIFRDFSNIRSRSFSAGLLNENIFGGKLGIAYSEPLRIYQGSANINIPTGVDQNGNVIRLNSKVSLSPSGKEKDFEVYYGLDLKHDSNISLNLSLQDEVNNVKDQMGYLGLVRYRIKF